MADYALLDQLGVGTKFNFRHEIEKYYGCGLSKQELEEEGSDIVLLAFLHWDWDQDDAIARFYGFCRLQLRALLRVAEKRGHTISLTSIGDGRYLSRKDVYVRDEPLRNLMDEHFMEKMDALLEAVFSEKGDEKYLQVARKYFLEAKTIRAVAAEMGQKYTEQVHRIIKVARGRIRDYVRQNRDSIYSHFDEPLADVIIDFAKA